MIAFLLLFGFCVCFENPKQYHFHDFKITCSCKFVVKQDNGVFVEAFEQSQQPFGHNASGWKKVVDVDPKFYQEAYEIASLVASKYITYLEADALWKRFDEKVLADKERDCAALADKELDWLMYEVK